MQVQSRRVYQFGAFHLDADERLLLKDEQVVPLTPKAFDALVLLVENSGRLISKETFLAEVWRDSFVEENTVNRSISILRKALGETGGHAKYIETVPKHGYRFVAEVSEAEDQEPLLILEKHTSAEIITEEEVADTCGRELREAFSGSAALAAPADVDSSQKGGFWWQLRARPVAVGLLLLLLAGVVYLLISTGVNRSDSPATLKSIAVLPFKNLHASGDPDFLGIGMADVLITRLGALRNLKVQPMSAILRLQNQDALAAGRALGVDGVLEGNLQTSNNRIRLTARLIRVSDGATLWAEQFDETEADLFKLQDALSLRMAQSLQLELNQLQRELLSKRYTDNVEAYQAYLRGRFFFDRRDRENHEKAIVEYERAISLDPNYALAYSGLADAYGMLPYHQNEPRHPQIIKARVNAHKALELDDNLAEAHTSMACVYRAQDWDWDRAEKHFQRAIELNPNYVNARQWYALLLLTLGRGDEAFAQIEKARETDPVAKTVLRNKVQIQTLRRQTAELIPLCEQLAALEENKTAGLRDLAVAYERVGEYAKAFEVAEEFRKLNNNKLNSTNLVTSLAIAYARTGQEASSKEMLAYLEQVPKTDTGAIYQRATIHSTLGDKETALALLQKCFANRDDRMLWIKLEPRFDPLRNDPRFKDILRKMNLAD